MDDATREFFTFERSFLPDKLEAGQASYLEYLVLLHKTVRTSPHDPDDVVTMSLTTRDANLISLGLRLVQTTFPELQSYLESFGRRFQELAQHQGFYDDDDEEETQSQN